MLTECLLLNSILRISSGGGLINIEVASWLFGGVNRLLLSFHLLSSPPTCVFSLVESMRVLFFLDGDLEVLMFLLESIV